MPSGGFLHPVGDLHWGYLLGLGRCPLVWVIGLGSKARGSSGSDGFCRVAGRLQICTARVLDFVDRSYQTIFPIY